LGSADVEGKLWGARAADWARVQQGTIRPACLAVLEELGPTGGLPVLDIGCGAGVFLSLAAERGALVSGLDACAEFIDIAWRRVPPGRFRLGDMERIPFPDNEFAVVTAFNSLHFASDPPRAVAEAIRVTRPGGRLVIATWGPPADCDALEYLLDLGGLMPPDTPGAALDLSDPDQLRMLLVGAGLAPSEWRTVPCPWEYPDLDTALRGLLSTGPATRATNHSGRARVAETVRESISPYRRDDGSYLLNNVCFYLVATR
jgi:SAM-dependent methyltransferase